MTGWQLCGELAILASEAPPASLDCTADCITPRRAQPFSKPQKMVIARATQLVYDLQVVQELQAGHD